VAARPLRDPRAPHGVRHDSLNRRERRWRGSIQRGTLDLPRQVGCQCLPGLWSVMLAPEPNRRAGRVCSVLQPSAMACMYKD